ncbi:BatA domain-containing protein [Novipirellula artificiosorum]|uniref:VWFA domain-containing protein n=1 Tax=Novipirellula artificiosorum TaxID=2528016 RepID=A0A5C6DXY5_9BACT|nr:BatA domain-containing protein [Novipirellula artificiosorum]TWU41104.1 hypothetical protein Poly41_19420 [Novipirellula artificiosorum]
MSLLAPVFFLGALAIGLPILFHLIRQQPKGSVSFSSLMFLRPTPPRLTRRSRLENWPLLLMRALAILLLAAAFARPFFRTADNADVKSFGRRFVLMIDTSASMQRAGIWSSAVRIAKEFIEELGPGDQLAIVTFDNRPEQVFRYDPSQSLTPPQRRDAAMQRVNGLKPSWRATQLGQALRYSADVVLQMQADEEADAETSTDPLPTQATLVLVSDLQSGSEIESLQSYGWPEQIKVDLRRVQPTKATNAWAQVLSDVNDPAANRKRDDGVDRTRVRVSNSADAGQSQFRLSWQTDKPSAGSEIPVTVPPGQSRVLMVPAATPETTSLVLRGDDHPFDNQRFLAAPKIELARVLYLGDDSDTTAPRDSLFYYLNRVPFSNSRRTVSTERVETFPTLEADETPLPLVVVSKPATEAEATQIHRYAERGGSVLLVLADQNARWASSIAQVAAVDPIQVSEAKIDDYVMLSSIAFDHPLFLTMSDPQFNDFSKIRFWAHQTIKGIPESASVLATFDDGDPAIVEIEVGQGRVWILTAGWQPRVSQLALSTKFIPLMFQFFEAGRRGPATRPSYFVGDPVSFAPTPTAKIVKPDGSTFDFASTSTAEQIDRPGVYQYVDGDDRHRFAVNLDPAESQTDPMDFDSLQRFGVVTGKTTSVAEAETHARQLRDVELEKSQKVWQWLILAALALIAAETLYSGRRKGLAHE